MAIHNQIRSLRFLYPACSGRWHLPKSQYRGATTAIGLWHYLIFNLHVTGRDRWRAICRVSVGQEPCDHCCLCLQNQVMCTCVQMLCAPRQISLSYALPPGACLHFVTVIDRFLPRSTDKAGAGYTESVAGLPAPSDKTRFAPCPMP